MSDFKTQCNWIAVAGVSVTSILEIFCREGRTVLLIGKNGQILSEASYGTFRIKIYEH